MFFRKERMERREPAALMVRVRVNDRDCDAMVGNASSRGLMAMMVDPPAKGGRVKVEIGEHSLPGRVRWSHGDRCGIALKDEIRVPDFVKGLAVPVSRMTEREVRGISAGSGWRSFVRSRAVQLVVLAALLGGSTLVIARMGSGEALEETTDLALSTHDWD
ncbi:PilZ domain-containing protein [Novosphingobium sp. KN65.2]|uniref:PilZ domain-containing protein n=1 Tax=Novosphingobium sp. KN65.2 TaxID=1478134 RepID=UPI0005E4E2B3|nr:PilZ domain-containing protein [Novosphingobium sp. KN65.2]CDO35395.1 hypothetical protein SPHV1_2240034 [Novosphingobium sp. KN65.2]